MRYRGLIVAVAVVGLIGGACGGSDEADGGGGGGGGGTPTDTITMLDNEFQPSDPVVSTGSALTLTNEGNALHSFTIDDQGIDGQVQPGADLTVDISLAAGDYDFVCSFHPEMIGTLTVE